LNAADTAQFNTAVGDYAMQATTGSSNTGIGAASLYDNSSGQYNTALGHASLQSNTTASNNTAVGYSAGYASAGANNVFLGFASGNDMTTGSNNSILGRFSGNQGGLDIRTSDNNIVLSDGDGNPRVIVDSSGKMLVGTTTNTYSSRFVASLDSYDTYCSIIQLVSATNAQYGLRIQFSGQDPNNTTSEFIAAFGTTTKRFVVYANGNVSNTNNSYGAISDVKLKENIVDASSQWDDIKNLTVRKYSLKADSLDAPNMLGVIAQEVEAAGMGGLVYESPDRDPQTNDDLGTVTKQVNYSILYMKAVKALQEAMTRIETLEAKVTALEGN
jgi:hypothetical protein